jgi:hypothetical protein
MNPRRVGGIVVIGALLPMLLGASPADAKKKKKKPKSPPVTVVTNTQTTSTDNQQLTVTATCPAGKIAVGGGITALPSFTGTTLNGLHIIYESRRLGTNAWQGSVVRDDGGGPGPALPVTTSVDCRTPKLATKKAGKAGTDSKKKKVKKLKITEATATGTAPPDSEAPIAATATCPPKTLALGGGFSSSPTPDLSASAFPLFFASYRNTPTTWLSAFINAGSVVRTATSYAYCAAGLKLAETSGSAALPGSSVTSVGQAIAIAPACTKGRSLLGGGFNNSQPTDPGPAPFLDSTAALSRTWQVGAWNLSLDPGTLGATGYCA